MRELVVLTPVLNRPHRVAPLLASIHEATPDARVLFLTDPGDEAEHDAIRKAQVGAPLRVDVVDCGGNYAFKINTGVKQTDELLLFLGADDLDFYPGWFNAAIARLTDEIGVVGTNDLCNKRVMAGVHSTHSLVSREYAELGTVDDPDRLLHEGYQHEWVDDEFIQTAISRNAFISAHDAIVEHLHPMAGKAPMDDLYAGIDRRLRHGRRLYRRRARLWM